MQFSIGQNTNVPTSDVSQPTVTNGFVTPAQQGALPSIVFEDVFTEAIPVLPSPPADTASDTPEAASIENIDALITQIDNAMEGAVPTPTIAGPHIVTAGGEVFTPPSDVRPSEAPPSIMEPPVYPNIMMTPSGTEPRENRTSDWSNASASPEQQTPTLTTVNPTAENGVLPQGFTVPNLPTENHHGSAAIQMPTAQPTVPSQIVPAAMSSSTPSVLPGPPIVDTSSIPLTSAPVQNPTQPALPTLSAPVFDRLAPNQVSPPTVVPNPIGNVVEPVSRWIENDALRTHSGSSSPLVPISITAPQLGTRLASQTISSPESVRAPNPTLVAPQISGPADLVAVGASHKGPDPQAVMSPTLNTTALMAAGAKDSPAVRSVVSRENIPSVPDGRTPPTSAFANGSNAKAVSTGIAQNLSTPTGVESRIWQTTALDLEASPELRSSPDGTTVLRGPSDSLMARPELPRHISQQMREAFQRTSSQQVELHLNPMELGRVKISMQTTDGSVVMHIIADRQETTDLLRRNMDLLAQDFREIGFANATFSFADQQMDRDGADADDGSAGPSDPESSLEDEVRDLTENSSQSPTRISDRVDIRL